VSLVVMGCVLVLFFETVLGCDGAHCVLRQRRVRVAVLPVLFHADEARPEHNFNLQPLLQHVPGKGPSCACHQRILVHSCLASAAYVFWLLMKIIVGSRMCQEVCQPIHGGKAKLGKACGETAVPDQIAAQQPATGNKGVNNDGWNVQKCWLERCVHVVTV
jgi:hypothetical protein